MTERHARGLQGLTLAAVLAFATGAQAAGEINIYSARHYDTDRDLYAGFTEQTGIRVNLIEGESDALIQRMVSEGANSPADVFVTVDAGRLWRADQAGLFQPTVSKLLDERIPADLRHPEGHYFGLSTRARIIFHDRARFPQPPADTYEGLADPALAGEVCIRSGSNVYNQSLLAALIEVHGEAAAEEWARGVVANFARQPQGGDTDQITAVAAGECGVALANHYYFIRLLREAPSIVERIGWVFPNQDDRGTHVNIGGAGVVANAPNRDNAVAFLEYLASDEAQTYFADGNNEYPVVEGAAANSFVQELGSFRRHPLNVSVYGTNAPRAQMIFDRVGWR
jgi:iron(III) transport system substrate-binding protein